MNIINENVISRDLRVRKLLLASGLLLVLAVLFLMPPENTPFAACGFHALTGHSCLTCGMTRSLHAMSHGQLIASLRYHMMGPVIFVGVFLFSLTLLVEGMMGKRIRLAQGKRYTKQTAWLFAIVWLVYWGARLIVEFAG